mmetsp:Transcript_29343/g.94106  ORF Transcript_29343/g.94106 Transcript_29343/m.94106 type:complete len:121 (-) Transcript_29343:3113-3475(-)
MAHRAGPCVAHLVSMPLCRMSQCRGERVALAELCYQEERDELLKVLREEQVPVRLRTDFATTDRFHAALDCTILHFTGHGEREGLILEVRKFPDSNAFWAPRTLALNPDPIPRRATASPR